MDRKEAGMGGEGSGVADLYGAYPYPPVRRGGAWSRRRRRLLDEGARLGDMLAARNPGVAKGRVLDAGCGTGMKLAGLSRALAGAEITGADMSGASLEAAAAVTSAEGAGNVSLRAANLEDTGSLPGLGRFDAIVCDGVLHHLGDPDGVFAALAGLLDPGGLLYVSVFSRVGRPHESRLREIVRRVAAGRGGFESGIRIARSLLRLPSMVSERHSGYYEDDAFLADAFLNPVEHLFDVPGLCGMCRECGLEFLTWPEGERHEGPLREALESAGVDAGSIGRPAMLGLVELWKAPAMISALAARVPAARVGLGAGEGL